MNIRACAAVIVRAMTEDGLTDAEVADVLTDVTRLTLAKARVALGHVRPEVGI